MIGSEDEYQSKKDNVCIVNPNNNGKNFITLIVNYYFISNSKFVFSLRSKLYFCTFSSPSITPLSYKSLGITLSSFL